MVVRNIGLVVVLILPAISSGQGLSQQPTPPPTVTAESEPWFAARAPLLFGGTLYYPAGPQVHFNQNEMVTTGYFGAVPVYVRTTIEPRSVIFVPLSGGLMQPYERRRSSELAGSEGSERSLFASQAVRAADPPMSAASAFGSSPTTFAEAVQNPPPTRAVGTSGMIRKYPLASAARPEGLNGVFVNFDNQRWFSSGEAVPFEVGTFRPIGSHGGFAVYSHPAHPGTIYIPVAKEAAALVAPYSNVRRR